MATTKKHLVKCPYCGETFDANKEPFVMVNSRRYAHKKCAEKKEKEKSKEEIDKENLQKYIKQLFGINTLSAKINKQIDRFIKENEYTYSGIHRSLIYFYEIKKNPIDKANEGLGIVPWIYEEAKRYYYNLWLAQQRNTNKVIEDYKPKEVIITIPPPERKVKRRKIFSFLDKEEKDV